MSEVIEGIIEFDEDNALAVISNGIERLFSDVPYGFFSGEITCNSVKEAVKWFERGWEDAKDRVDLLEEDIIKLCIIEASIYFQIADVDGSEAKLSAAKQRVVRWLRTKSKEEQQAILEEVREGVRLRTIERRENKAMKKDRDERGTIQECKRISDEIVQELNTSGHTQLTTSIFLDKWQSSSAPDSRTIKSFTESTRDRLNRNRGRGLGDDMGTYMLVSKCDRTQVAQIVQVRLESIVNDLKTIKKICDETHFVVPKKGVQIISDLINSLASPTITELSLDV